MTDETHGKGVDEPDSSNTACADDPAEDTFKKALEFFYGPDGPPKQLPQTEAEMAAAARRYLSLLPQSRHPGSPSDWTYEQLLEMYKEQNDELRKERDRGNHLEDILTDPEHIEARIAEYREAFRSDRKEFVKIVEKYNKRQQSEKDERYAIIRNAWLELRKAKPDIQKGEVDRRIAEKFGWSEKTVQRARSQS